MLSSTPQERTPMPDSSLALLAEARRVLDRYMFDGDLCRDDIAEVCQKIDDLLPVNPTAVAQKPARVAA
jgi:hypothetical protein